jgi:amino acid adenylation domain-containing protein
MNNPNEYPLTLSPYANLCTGFEAQAQKTPEAIAARFENAAWSYCTLNARANQLAHHLISLGAGPGTLVGIAMPRGLEMLASVLAVLKSGAAYVPLDPNYPAQRLDFMVHDARCAVLILSSQSCLNFEGHRVILDTQGERIFQSSDTHNPEAHASPHDLAYVIYTSGSTGQPKGVEIAHGAAVNFITAAQAQFALQPHDVVLAVASLSFDMSVLDVFLPLSIGACVVIASAHTSVQPGRLLQAMDNHQATVLQATPATWKLLVDAGLGERRTLKALVGGDAFPQDLAQALHARLGEVWNLYGPTEATVYTTAARYVGGKPLIGQALANTEVLILDEAGQRVPNGAIGELHIGGAGLARGYRQRPELTREKFIPHPTSAIPGARLYKSGDLARTTPSGALECLGRIDRQVKIRGHRIELGEIEHLLRSFEGVRDSAVVDVVDSSGQKSLTGYIVVDSQAAPEPAQLREALRAQLPEFMVPAQLLTLEAMPLNANGKVDPQALRAHYQQHCAKTPTQPEGTPPHGAYADDPVQERLYPLWCQALGRTHMAWDASFFDQGGHSLIAVSLTMRLEEAFGIAIPLDALWNEGHTIAGMSALIRSLVQPTTPPSARSRLVTLKPGSERKAPLFVLHTMRGSVNEYQALASHLAPDQTVIGVRSKGLYGDVVPAPHIRQFALDCVDAIREHSPQGPYHIAGYSVAGLIAYEVALILSAAHEKIVFLGIIDTPAPHFKSTVPLRTRIQQKWATAQKRTKHWLEPVRHFFKGNTADNWAGLGGTDPARISQHAAALFESLRLAESTYQVSAPCPVPIELIIAQSAAPSDARHGLGWKKFAQAGFTCHRVTANTHEDMMAPHHATALAHVINTKLTTCISQH